MNKIETEPQPTSDTDEMIVQKSDDYQTQYTHSDRIDDNIDGGIDTNFSPAGLIKSLKIPEVD